MKLTEIITALFQNVTDAKLLQKLIKNQTIRHRKFVPANPNKFRPCAS
jgi:hypothetical protein